MTAGSAPPHDQAAVLGGRRNGFAAPAELTAIRGATGSFPGAHAVDPRVTVREDEFGGTRAIVVTPPAPSGTLLHFHGGGFRLGSAAWSTGFASAFAMASRCTVILPDYGLAPEAPFPAALLDGEAALSALCAQRQPLVIGGDSAGGNIATVLAQRHAASGRDPLCGLLLFSPWLDLTVSAASFHANGACDTMFSQSSAQAAAALYLQGHSARDPHASPLFGDVAMLPPTFISVGSIEVLLDDSLAFAARLAAGHRAVTLVAVPQMAHVAATLSPAMPGARETLAAAAAWTRDRLDEAVAARDNPDDR